MRIEILDTTLRDGTQSEAIAFSLPDKLSVTAILDKLGVSFIEGGTPSSNPKDAAYFREVSSVPLKNSKVVAFGSTMRKDALIDTDTALKALIAADCKFVSVFGKSSEAQASEVLGVAAEENLRLIFDTVKYLVEAGKEVIFDAEHFFDGYAANREYSLKVLSAASKGGAKRLVLCDTNGGSFPEAVGAATADVVKSFPNSIIGIHCHNDMGLATACSLAAVKAGATHVQGTLLGFGERCGNANLSTLIPILQLKLNYDVIPPENMHLLTSAAYAVAETANVTLHKNMPFVGVSAFSHKAGMHSDAVAKTADTFEHISPDAVGNKRKLLLSEIAGRSAVLNKIHTRFPELDKDSPELAEVVRQLKLKESEGYQFEGADASFFILVDKLLGRYKRYFELINFKVISEQPPISGTAATAIIKIKVGNTVAMATGEGDGPVHALDIALRHALKEFYPVIDTISLSDYKVRVIDTAAATAAVVRVLITTSDCSESWTTIGVSADIIEASWNALCDSIEYKLSKSI